MQSSGDRPVKVSPPLLPFVFAVGVTGHRKDALPPDSLLTLHERLATVLQALTEKAAQVRSANRQFFSDDPPRLMFVSPLADGADQIAAEIALRLGFDLHAVLPFERDRYRKEMSDEDCRLKFDALLSRASCVLELPGEVGHHLESYVMAGRATIAHCDLLIAVWDGLPPRGRGGTGEVVRLAHDRATPIIHVPVAPTDETTIRWTAFDPAVVTHAEDRSNVRTFSEDEIGAVLNAVLAPPPDEQERGFILKFQAESQRRIRARIEYPLLLAATGVSRLRRHHWRADVASAQTEEE